MHRSPRGQLPLLLPPEQDSFEQFVVVADNRLAVEQLRSVSGLCMFVYGVPQSGRSHLLRALCRESELGCASLLQLAKVRASNPAEACERLAEQRLICVDDMDCVAGDCAWERELFVLFERVRQQGGTLVLSALEPPASLGIRLPDLASRLEAALTLRLAPLDDEHKGELLRRRAAQLGLKLDAAAAGYILRNSPRGPAELLQLLDELAASLTGSHRRVSVATVRRVIGEMGAPLAALG